MKRCLVLLLCSAVLIMQLVGCGKEQSSDPIANEKSSRKEAEKVREEDSGNASLSEGEKEKSEKTQIAITVGETILYADMYDTELAKEFVDLLPQKISMQRVGGGREFYGTLEGSLHYDEADSQTTFENGEIAYWYSGNGLCLLYDNQVEEPEVDSGIIVLGKITSDFSILHEIGDETEVSVSIADK